MSPITALRARRALHGLPSSPSDEELLAWSQSLVAADGAAPARPRRTEPLRARARADHLSLDELLVEIRDRASAATRRP